MPIPPTLADRPEALLPIATRTGQELARRRLRPLGISVQMCGVLNVLAAGGPVSQQALGGQLGIDRTTVVELIDELEGRGVVARVRNPADRRSYSLTLTPHGRAFQKRAAKVFAAAASDLFEPLAASERKALTEMLRRMIASGDRHLKESSA